MKADEFNRLKRPYPVDSAHVLRKAREMRAEYLADLGQRGATAAGRLLSSLRRVVDAPRRAISS